MRRLQWLSILAFVFFLAPPASRAQPCYNGSPYTWFGLTANLGAGMCYLPTGFSIVYVVAYTNPASKVRIKIPDRSGLTAFDPTWNYPVTGDRINGLEFDLGCAQGVIVLGTMPVIVSTPGRWTVAQDCEVKDCDGTVQLSAPMFSSAFAGTCGLDCIGVAPYGLNPPDGATGVSPVATLSWAGPPSQANDFCYIRIGTAPDCSNMQLIAADCAAHSAALNLQPATTYYWYADYTIDVPQCGRGGNSAVHSFTTAGPLPVATSTWGKVKAMYRD